jgi:hypothetical protein
LSAGFCVGAHRRCRVAEEGFHLSGEVNTLIMSSYTLLLKCYTSTKVLSLKYFLLLYLVISKQSCNNLISTLIMILSILYVFVHSCFIENPPIDLEAIDPTF